MCTTTQWHKGIDQGAWKQSPSLPPWSIGPAIANILFHGISKFTWIAFAHRQCYTDYFICWQKRERDKEKGKYRKILSSHKRWVRKILSNHKRWVSKIPISQSVRSINQSVNRSVDRSSNLSILRYCYSTVVAYLSTL